MSTPVIANASAPEGVVAFAPTTTWRLDEKSLFPATPEEWDILLDLPSRPKPQAIGVHAYDLLVNRKARRPMTGVIAKLFTTFRQDFESASNGFESVQWRMLYYLDMYPLAAVANPGFDPLQAFRKIRAQDDWNTGVPAEWTGSAVPNGELLEDIENSIRTLDPDVAKAAWCILAFARCLGFEQNDVIQVPWWQPWWIERYLAAAR